MVSCAAAGTWFYKPCEYEAWMLRRMMDENDRGILHVGYPGLYLTLEREPEAVYAEAPPDGYVAVPGDTAIPPHRMPWPEFTYRPAFTNGYYDLGREDLGYVRIRAVTPPVLFAGESLAEMRNDNPRHFEQSMKVVPVGNGEWRSDIPLALRYFRFTTPVEDVRFSSQVDRSPVRGSFCSGNRRMDRIWRTALETQRLCTRTFLLDGIKRDRLPWACDLVFGLLSQAYAVGDPEPVRRSLVAMGTAAPEAGDVNGIVANTFWWIIDHDLFQRHFGDRCFLMTHYPQIRDRIDHLATRCDGRGFVVRDILWDFMDWVDNRGTELVSEVSRQEIYYGALCAGVRLAERTGDCESTARWRTRAALLKRSILAQGMDGTRHARLLAILFGLVEGEDARRYGREIVSGGFPKTVTPNMSAFEILALLKCGETLAAREKLEAVWGAMSDRGVDAFWEGWNADEKGDEAYVYYGRPFGKSLCHIWGAAPLCLFAGGFLGIRPTSDGWATHEVKPVDATLFPEAKVSIPTARGVLSVTFADGKKVKETLE